MHDFNRLSGLHPQQTYQQIIDAQRQREAEEIRKIEEKIRADRAELQRAEEARLAFLRAIADAVRPVIREEVERAFAAARSESIGMYKGARIGPATVKGNKLKPIDKASVSQKIARKAKADRIEKGLRKNRQKSKG